MVTGWTRVARRASGGLTVTFAEWGQAQQIANITEIKGIQLLVQARPEDNLVLGVISHTKIEHLEKEELAELIGDQQ
ncbi:hypothetical protein Hamer_G017975 [Homarus americanus]|uniref:Uncharacterized protein n=1 Tax=Homarus americanus TaxID=6706 RepID=A0A8J5N5E3_HOMAM|nr:hypothetical protein Hamer_G017975 [Homarus americanus]